MTLKFRTCMSLFFLSKKFPARPPFRNRHFWGTPVHDRIGETKGMGCGPPPWAHGCITMAPEPQGQIGYTILGFHQHQQEGPSLASLCGWPPGKKGSWVDPSVSIVLGGLEQADARGQREHSGGHARGFHGVRSLVKGPCHVHIVSFDICQVWVCVSFRVVVLKVVSSAASVRLHRIVVDKSFFESLCTENPAPPLPAARDFVLRRVGHNTLSAIMRLGGP